MKKLIIGIIIGLILSVSGVLAATILYGSDEVSFDNTTSHLKNTNNEITLEEALDSLYDETSSYGCPSDRNISFIGPGVYHCAHKTYAMPSGGYTCVRASWLHTEKCLYTSGSSSTYYCYADGYYTSGSMGTNLVTYGNLGTQGADLETGDALDCDVNGNGYIDVDEEGYSTERFYYVSPRWTPGTDTSDSSFDSSTAVLIYYSNTYNGAISNTGAAYATLEDAQAAGSTSTATYQNWWGPVTAVKHLPKTKANGGTWDDFIIKDNNNESKRAIIACNDANCTTARTSTSGGSLPQGFSYTGYAGRLLTIPEIKKAGCDTLSGNNITSLGTTGALKACNFLMERTKYTNSALVTLGPWPENACSSNSNNAWNVYSYNRGVGSVNVPNTSYGARPAIEVSISKILK